MAYSTPVRLDYEEKLLGDFLTWKQFFILTASGIVYLMVHSSGLSPAVRGYVTMAVVCLGFGLAFFGLDRTLLRAAKYGYSKLLIWRMSDSVYDFLGVREIRDNAILLKVGSCVAVIEVQGLEFSLMSEENRKTVIESFKTFLNAITFEMEFVISSVEPDLTGFFKRLMELNRENSGDIRSYMNFLMTHIRENEVMDRRGYVVVRFKSDRPLLDVSATPFGKAREVMGFDELDKRVATVQELLRDVGLESKRLDDDGLSGLLVSYLGAIPTGEVELSYDCIAINKKKHQIIEVREYPDSLYVGLFDRLVLMPGDFKIAFHVKPMGGEESMLKLNDQHKKVSSDVRSYENKGNLPPVLLQITNEGTERLLRKVQSGETRLFRSGFFIDVSSYTRNGLRKKVDVIYSRLRSVLMEPAIVTLDILNGYRSTLPLAQNRLNSWRTMDSDVLAACFPFLTSGMRTEGNPVQLGFNDDTGLPFFSDKSALMNGNTCIFGMTGAGKSYAAKDILIKLYHYPHQRIFVIDKAGEFSPLIERLGGQVIRIAPNSDESINPMERFEGMDMSTKKISLMAFFHSLFEITPAQETLLYSVFDDAYAMKGYTDDPATWDNEAPRVRDVYKLIQNRASSGDVDGDEIRSVKALLRKLKVYTQGAMGSVVDAKSNANLHNRLIGFDISGVPRPLISAVMYTLFEYLTYMRTADMERKLPAPEGAGVLRVVG